MSRVTALVGACCLLVGPASGPAVAEDTEFTVHVSYDEFQEFLRPRPGRAVVKDRFTVTALAGDLLHIVNVRNYPAGKTFARTAEATLGGAGEGKEYPNVRWTRPVGGATYQRVLTAASYVRTLAITIEGRTCRAEVRFDLRPGFSEYQMVRVVNPTEKPYLKTLRADNVKCWVGDYLVS